MALTNCPDCQKEVSNKALACIHCGFPLNEPSNNYQYSHALVIILMFALGAMSLYIFSTLKTNNKELQTNVIAKQTPYQAPTQPIEHKETSLPTKESTEKSKKSFDIKKLIGVWAPKGKCHSEQYIYTADGKYITKYKKNGKWDKHFDGFYNTEYIDPSSFVITEGQHIQGYVVEVETLTTNKLIGITLSDDDSGDYPFNFIRCP